MRMVDKNHQKEGRQRREDLKQNFCTLMAENTKEGDNGTISTEQKQCSSVKLMPREDEAQQGRDVDWAQCWKDQKGGADMNPLNLQLLHRLVVTGGKM